jgi:hypothetical protein
VFEGTALAVAVGLGTSVAVAAGGAVCVCAGVGIVGIGVADVTDVTEGTGVGTKPTTSGVGVLSFGNGKLHARHAIKPNAIIRRRNIRGQGTPNNGDVKSNRIIDISKTLPNVPHPVVKTL